MSALALALTACGTLGVLMVAFRAHADARARRRARLRHPAVGGSGPAPAPTDWATRADRVGARLDRPMGMIDPRGRLRHALEEGGVPVRPATGALMAAGAAGLTGLSAAVLVGPLAGGAAAVLALAALAGLLSRRIERRRRDFRACLPDCLSLLAGALAAGHALVPAVEAVARDAPSGARSQWQRAARECQIGADIADALDRVALRTRSTDLRWAVLCVRLSRDVGGSLSEVLLGVAASVRERERARRRMLALTAEGRLSAIVLCGLPVAFALYLALMRPEYLHRLLSSTLGLSLSGGAITLVAAGTVWMRLLVRQGDDSERASS